MTSDEFANLPGGEILAAGIRDLIADRLTVEALILIIGAPRLKRHGVLPSHLPEIKNPEETLYQQLVAEHGRGAYARYNALLGRLASLENALDSLATAAAQRR